MKLRPFMHFLDENAISPDAVDDETFKAFRVSLDNSLVKDVRKRPGRPETMERADCQAAGAAMPAGNSAALTRTITSFLRMHSLLVSGRISMPTSRHVQRSPQSNSTTF